MYSENTAYTVKNKSFYNNLISMDLPDNWVEDTNAESFKILSEEYRPVYAEQSSKKNEGIFVYHFKDSTNINFDDWLQTQRSLISKTVNQYNEIAALEKTMQNYRMGCLIYTCETFKGPTFHCYIMIQVPDGFLILDLYCEAEDQNILNPLFAECVDTLRIHF